MTFQGSVRTIQKIQKILNTQHIHQIPDLHQESEIAWEKIWNFILSYITQDRWEILSTNVYESYVDDDGLVNIPISLLPEIKKISKKLGYQNTIENRSGYTLLTLYLNSD